MAELRCHYQFSAIVDTMFHDSHLPLTTWFVVTYLMTESKKGISASEVYRMLGKKSYKTSMVFVPPHSCRDGCCGRSAQAERDNSS